MKATIGGRPGPRLSWQGVAKNGQNLRGEFRCVLTSERAVVVHVQAGNDAPYSAVQAAVRTADLTQDRGAGAIMRASRPIDPAV